MSEKNYLKKEQSLFKRGGDGELLSQEVTLELLKDKPVIKAIPMNVGKIQELYGAAKENNDPTKDIILNYCKEPCYSDEDLDVMKPQVAAAIVTAIMSLSLDMSQDEIKNEGAKKVLENNELMQKKS